MAQNTPMPGFSDILRRWAQEDFRAMMAGYQPRPRPPRDPSVVTFKDWLDARDWPRVSFRSLPDAEDPSVPITFVHGRAYLSSE